VSTTPKDIVLSFQLRSTGGNVKQMYDVLLKYQPKDAKNPYLPNDPPIPQPFPQPSNSGALKWNQTNCGQGLQFENSGSLVILKEPAYVFRTSVANLGFSSGLNYWEIIPDPRT
jgi:E3 ubiquitin-protein ligase NRDP1